MLNLENLLIPLVGRLQTSLYLIQTLSNLQVFHRKGPAAQDEILGLSVSQRGV